MTDEIALARDIQRAREAKEALDNEVLAEAFATLEATYIAAWRSTPARDIEAREELWKALINLGKVQDHIKAVIGDGKIAAKEIELGGRTFKVA